ncbi:putative ribonucleotide reductase large subunit [Campylobacter phage F370]|uniref:Putative ribonucleotide reductase large subunit n=3 Tax=Fletchervirus CPX TaxID=1110702 RepID=A0A7T3KI09_9CAUD|nr:putative ribonucleotide reductase large subunit [Campylobacter phage F352]QPX65111.1 putative ribonucleotide reductase large subunit [Campylobacter phage F370]QPX65275.1 putative ribonucleotide reductase large subunit [Campylobacter phage F371]QPX65601.1 putative ribonucleotide reductase large subunit [Campylobacter phage F374]QPX65768.1 putative ribonucleotide reductase large subunit [Campylobacter phage F375]QXO06032.1 hypothetical protein [Campylobacter phage CJLB-10]
MNEINVVKTYTNGEIALCNLASINLHEYDLLNDTEKYNLIYDIVSTMDNTIDLAYYMVKDAQTANKKYRYLGIGVSNLAVLLAKHKIIIDSQESLEFQAKLFDELLYNCVKASMQLAIEKGRAEGFNETKWAKGLYPYLIGNKKAKKLIKFKPDENKWNKLMEDVKKYGMRNCALMAIAPTATSGRSINASESIEPIQKLLYKEDGNINIKTLAPMFKEYNQYYKLAQECDPMMLIKAAAVRQLFLDQSQSVNMYSYTFNGELNYIQKSSHKLSLLHMYAHQLGLKTLYYFKSEKDNGVEHECESCS